MFSRVISYGRAAWNMYVLERAELPYAPEYIALEVTNVCNFKCKFCPQSDSQHHHNVPRSYLDPEACASFLGKVRGAGITTNLMHWTLDGEPFMNKQFAELVRVSAGFGFTNTYFASNGMLCTAERLAEFPLDRVRLNIAIDFCADKGCFEEVRGTKDSWDRVRANIEQILHDPRTQNVGLELTDISSFSERDPQKLRAAFESLVALCGQHPNLRYSARVFHNATGFVPPMPKRRGNYHLCPYPWTHFRIASDGDIVICCRDLDHKTVLGNLKTQSVQEIWNGAKMVAARRALLAQDPDAVRACRGCDLPYDDSKFTVKNIYRAARGRMQLFSK